METNRRKALLLTLPGGDALVGTTHSLPAPASPVPLAYWSDDEARNTGAANLIANKQIGIPDFNPESGTYTFACYSSLTVERDSNPTVYSITFSPADGVACTCQDFGHRGGAFPSVMDSGFCGRRISCPGTPPCQQHPSVITYPYDFESHHSRCSRHR
ncbi:hypothetical protein BC629DRAFT_1545442 [Irpex lacteus]|nr:hypothetical protein BC629DRAFT_1545442 [Irpex lacteus]